jgi:hypothetical protein
MADAAAKPKLTPKERRAIARREAQTAIEDPTARPRPLLRRGSARFTYDLGEVHL